MIGQTISHYVIAEKLGEGGMGVVYKAHDTSLDRNVALKFLPYYLTSSPNEKERFYHEARAAAALMHPNITVVHEIGEHENQVYISMEYVEGKTLKQIIEHDGESLKITKVLDFAIQICEGLTAAHEKGVVHRDIKSDNIMVTSKGQVKIMDFGLAKISGATKLTQSGSTVGTAAYMSPEQAKGEDVDHRSDIFSFGVVLYEMLTTHLPFKGEYQSALLYSILNDDPQPLARYNDNVPQELEHLVKKTLAKDKEERYQHADDLLADLKTVRKKTEYAQSGYIKSSSITKQNTESKDITKQKILKLLIPVSVLILLAVIILYFNPFEFRVTQKTSSETPGKSLAVMYFENIPDPADKDHTGEMLTNLLITSLSQLKGLEVISHERLLDIQKQLGHTESKVLSPSLANEVASHAGVGTMLIGSILQKNPDLAVTTRLIEVKSGKIISSQQVTSFPTDKIFSLVDSITYLLKDQFATPEVIKPVADVTTQSTEAYRAYVEGLDLMTKLFFEDAKGAFKRAVELDPGFAMAYYYMALMKMFTGDDRYATYQTFRKAAELADNVSERDRLLILAMNYRYMGKTADEEETLIRLVKKYPHEIFPYSYLIYLYNTDLFKPEKAQEVCLDGLKFNPTAKEIWNHLAYSYIYLNRKYEALNAVYNYIKLSPAEPNPYDTKGDVYAWFGDYDSSRISYIMAINLRRDFYSGTKIGDYAVINGKYNEASEYFRTSGYEIPVIEIHKGELRKALGKCKADSNYLRAIHLCYETRNYGEMLTLARAYSDELKIYKDEKIYGRDYIVWALVKNGKIQQAEELLNKMQAEASDFNTRFRFAVKYSSSLVLFEEKKYGKAVRQFEDAFTALPPKHEPNFFYAVSLLKSGETVKAVSEFQKIKDWPFKFQFAEGPGAMAYWPIQNVKSHYWLGAAYEKTGNREEAIKEYEHFMEIWKDYDFNSPEIRDAKIRIAKLKGVAFR